MIHALLDARSSRALPYRFRRWIERTALKSMRFRASGAHVPVATAEPLASLVAVGDISLHFLEHASPLVRKDPQRLMAGVGQVLAAADIRVGNLESVLTVARQPAATRGFALCAAPRAVEALVGAGFDAVTCANNHCLDFGPESLIESLAHLQSHGIRTVGAGRTPADARRPAQFTARGISLGMLGYSDDVNVAAHRIAGPAMSDDEAILDDIHALREQVDIVIVQLHWGYEYAMHPLLSQRNRARRFAEAGADIVLCHHAHVPMAVEAWKGRLIAHGLGNFLFGWRDSREHPWWNRSHMLRVTFNREGVISAEIIPCGAAPDHRVSPLAGAASREVLGAHGVLRERLGDEAFLRRLEEERIVREARRWLARVARCADESDAAGAAELSALLSYPRQRALVASLRRGWLDTGEEAAALLARIADSREEEREPLAIVREAGAASARLAGSLERAPQLRADPIGRVP